MDPYASSAIPSWLRPNGSDVRGSTPYSYVNWTPDSRYRLIDSTGRNDNTILGEAGTPEEFARLAAIVNNQLVPKGRSADWRLEQQTGGAWNTVGGDNYNRSGLSYVADIGLPIAGALLAPLTGGASAALLAGLGAAGGSALSGTIQGRSIGDIAKSAAISGLGAGLGAGAFGALSGAGSAAGGAAGGAGSAAGGGLASIAPVVGEQLVTNTVLPSLGASLFSAGAGGVAGGLAARSPSYQAQTGDEAVQTVTSSRLPPSVSGMDALPIASAGLAAGAAVPSLAAKPGSSTLEKIKAGLTLANLAGSAIGGGQNPGAAGSSETVKPSINPIFSAQLPGADAAYTGNGLAARDMSGTDWNRYGFGPEQSFFNNVPQAPVRMAEGGSLEGDTGASRQEFAVHGAGSGRDDAIDAKLSDGEYVIDAETVALLGDGSNKEGAARLDSLRVNLRKHKGRNLAKGDFSAKAKQPEAYMAGGRS